MAKHIGVEARSKSSITIRFMYLGVERRESIKLIPTKENIKFASNLRAEILNKIALQQFSYADYFPNSKYAKLSKKTIPTFGESAEKWLKIQKSEKAESAWDTYRKYLAKYWLPIFDQQPLDQIITSEIKEALATFEISAKTKNNLMIPMRGIFSDAYYDGVINENPTDRIKNQKFQKPEPDPFTQDEVSDILAFMSKNYNEQIYNYFEFAFYTGLRSPNEIIALQWQDVEENLATIRRGKVLGKLKETKTYQTRTIELNDRAINALTRQKKHTFLKSEYVFLNPVTSLPWNDGKAQALNYYYPSLKALKIRSRDPYQTRHTFATTMLMHGLKPMWVSQQMGHKNMQMLLNVYSKWIAMADESMELNKANEAIKSNVFAQKSHKSNLT